MTKEELAARLNGREYRDEVKPREYVEARTAGLVIVYGASDDLMEFDGAIRDEVGCYGGGTVLLDEHGLLSRDTSDYSDDLRLLAFLTRKAKARSIRAVWGKDGVSWAYETDIPHATFDVLEDGDVYCRGIVFALADIGGDQ